MQTLRVQGFGAKALFMRSLPKQTLEINVGHFWTLKVQLEMICCNCKNT